MPQVDATYPVLRARLEAATAAGLGKQFEAQGKEVKARFDAGLGVLLPKAWDKRLGDVAEELGKAAAVAFARRVAKALGHDFDTDIMNAWLAAAGLSIATSINTATRQRLDGADESRVDEVMTNLQTGGLGRHARSLTATTANFGVLDAARSAGADGKRWNTSSFKPRRSHVLMSGQVVAIDAAFSNGLHYPGDSVNGSPEDTANCKCSMTIL